MKVVLNRARIRFVVAGTAIYLALVIGIVIVISEHSSQLEATWSAEGPCTVQLSGHDMNATADGVAALTTCKTWLHGGDAAKPSGDQKCSYTRDGLAITVRDSGGAFYGWAYCTNLELWSTSGGSVPDIESDSMVPSLPSGSPLPTAP